MKKIYRLHDCNRFQLPKEGISEREKCFVVHRLKIRRKNQISNLLKNLSHEKNLFFSDRVVCEEAKSNLLQRNGVVKIRKIKN